MNTEQQAKVIKPLGPDKLYEIIKNSPCVDLAEFLKSSVATWDYMIGPFETITLEDLADKINDSHDISNVRTLIDYSLFKHLGTMVLRKNGDKISLIY